MAPDPRPRRHGHRRGVEPAGLKRWRLAHSRKADPRPRRHRRRSYDPVKSKPSYTGSRGGRYWQGPTRRRYDPPKRRRFAGIRSGYARARGYGGKLEGTIGRYGSHIGFLGALGYGVWRGYENGRSSAEVEGIDPTKRYFDILGVEYKHLTNFDFTSTWNIATYLKYKFFGINPVTGLSDANASAWVIPFWASFVGFIVSKLPFVPARVRKPLGGISKGALIASTIGALVLPGCGATGPQPPPTNSPTNTERKLALPILQHQYIGQNEGAY